MKLHHFRNSVCLSVITLKSLSTALAPWPQGWTVPIRAIVCQHESVPFLCPSFRSPFPSSRFPSAGLTLKLPSPNASKVWSQLDLKFTYEEVSATFPESVILLFEHGSLLLIGTEVAYEWVAHVNCNCHKEKDGEENKFYHVGLIWFYY